MSIVIAVIANSGAYRWGASLLLLLLLLLLPAAWSQTEAEVFRAGVMKHFPPHYMTSPLRAEPEGFAIDIMDAVAARAGLVPEYIVFDTWAQIQQALREHVIDVIPNMGITADRQVFARFTRPVETVPVRIFVRASDNRISRIEDLDGRRVSVVKSNIGVALMSSRLGPLPTVHSSLQEALLALLSAETDALVFPQPGVEWLLWESGLEDRVKAVGEPLFEVKRALAVREDRPQLFDRLDRAVGEVITDAGFHDIYRRWHSSPLPFWSINRVLLVAGIVILLLSAGFWMWRYRTLTVMERQMAALRERQLMMQSTETAAKLQVFFDQTLYFAGIMDLDGTLTDANQASLDTCGYRREDVLGKPFWETPWWRGSAEVQEKIRAATALAVRGEIFRCELPYWLADGTERLTDFALSPVCNDDGDIIFLAPTGNDITERKRAELALEEVRQEAETARVVAEQANRSKSAFLANMSHEIRTPMSAILGYADILAAHLQDPDDLVNVETIRRNGRYLLELLDDVLDLSKIEAGKLDVELVPCAPVDVVSEVHSLMEVRARDKGLAFIVEYDGLLPATIHTDPVRLRQILINLVGNAIKFTEHGEVRLMIRLLDARRPEARLQFVVTDTGIGMTPDQLHAIFDAFNQGDATMTRRFGGTGLGLTISRQLAALLNGEITVRSRVEQGSTFTLTLAVGNLLNVALTKPQLLQTSAAAPQQSLVALVGFHVLVVDDRDDIRYLVQRLIEQVGGITQTAADGRAALECVARAEADKRPFDAIVMDMQMPVMDGFEAIRRLRAQGFDKKIIALTAGAMLGEREKCLEAGCNSYLSKPVDGHRLIELIAEPAQEEPAQSMAGHSKETPQTESAEAADGSPQAYRILVVDDSQDAATALARLLGLNGYQVDTAFDGQSALSKAQTLLPDAVILDLNLPDISGFEVLQQLRPKPALAQTCFIALSGEQATTAANQSVQFDHHLLKPASLAELLALFERHQSD